MMYEGVNFSDAAAAKMSREEFESRHVNLFWKDRDEKTRKKMLAEAYSLMNPAKQSKKASK